MNNNLLAGGLPTTPDITNSLFRGTSFEAFQQIMLVDPASVLGVILPNLIGLIFVFGMIIFLFMLIWGAVSWISSGGDKAHIENARGRITSALVGLVILFSTFAVIKLIEVFFGINILSIDIGPLVIQ